MTRYLSDPTSWQDRKAFLGWLAGRHQARLNDGGDVGAVVRPGLYPPESMENMTNNSYRSPASFIEDGCDFKMEGDYCQFPLADLLRHVHASAELAHDPIPQVKNLELIMSKSLVAFEPVEGRMALTMRWGMMPLPSLVDDLHAWCANRVVRADKALSHGAEGPRAGGAGGSYDSLYYEWAAPVGAEL